MSQPTNNAMNYPKSEHNESFKDQDQFSTEGIKPFPNGSNAPPVGYAPRPPLTRIDSRNSFPIRPGFPNPQGVPIRPPNQQVRPPGPPFPQRPPGVPTRPPFQQPFPTNQGNPQLPIRPIGPNIRPGGPLPPRGIAPGPRPLVQQRSDPNSDQYRFERDFSRSQTLDSPDTFHPESNETAMNVPRNNLVRSDSNHSSNTNLNEEMQRPLSRNSSVDEKRYISNSQESLDRRSEHEYPSRPGSRMNQIPENENSYKNFSRPASAKENSQPEPKVSVNSKPPLPPSANLLRETQNSAENREQNSRSSTPSVIKPDKELEETNKNSLQLKNLTKAKRIEGDNDSGVDESTQGNDQSSNGDATSPRKSGTKPPKRISSATPSKNRSLSRDSKSPSLKSPDSAATTPGTTEKKKLPMNKIQVGSTPSPNLKEVRSKIGSLQNATHKPGGGNIKIEHKKIDLKNVTPRIEAKNDRYLPKGGEKKIISQKLQWNAKSKIGSLENASHKPVSSGKKIETVKLDFKDKAKSKVGSKDNMKHVPGGGDVKIENKKIEFNVQSKVGSFDNVQHKPKGGDKKIFDDKEYLRQMSAISSENHSLSGSQNSLPSQPDAARGADENLNQHR